MGGDEVRNDCLFALPDNAILFPLDLINLRLWYVYKLTKPLPQSVLHDVQYN